MSFVPPPSAPSTGTTTAGTTTIAGTTPLGVSWLSWMTERIGLHRLRPLAATYTRCSTQAADDRFVVPLAAGGEYGVAPTAYARMSLLALHVWFIHYRIRTELSAAYVPVSQAKAMSKAEVASASAAAAAATPSTTASTTSTSTSPPPHQLSARAQQLQLRRDYQQTIRMLFDLLWHEVCSIVQAEQGGYVSSREMQAWIRTLQSMMVGLDGAWRAWRERGHDRPLRRVLCSHFLESGSEQHQSEAQVHGEAQSGEQSWAKVRHVQGVVSAGAPTGARAAAGAGTGADGTSVNLYDAHVDRLVAYVQHQMNHICCVPIDLLLRGEFEWIAFDECAARRMIWVRE